LELPVILETAVQQVRQFLQVDRLIIYQFKIPAPSCLLDPTLDEPLSAAMPNLDGITYESRSSDSIPSVLHWMEAYSDVTLQHFEQRHRNGLTWATEPEDSNRSPIAALLKLAEDAPIRAELATPILVQGQLGGLLIAHQCWQPRQWQEQEKTLLRRIAEHLEIAIYQAKLYAELQ
ncbi:GAF domain-containing protein, partial [Pseudomonas sp. 30_B]|uniref:GAF domain-containing protein n=1 Tax=Pseudomonas sp. 30_B TaxID=2813575 RepID=UPI001A9D0ADC